MARPTGSRESPRDQTGNASLVSALAALGILVIGLAGGWFLNELATTTQPAERNAVAATPLASVTATPTSPLAENPSPSSAPPQSAPPPSRHE